MMPAIHKLVPRNIVSKLNNPGQPELDLDVTVQLTFGKKTLILLKRFRLRALPHLNSGDSWRWSL
jgi:hypothetical protein